MYSRYDRFVRETIQSRLPHILAQASDGMPGPVQQRLGLIWTQIGQSGTAEAPDLGLGHWQEWATRSDQRPLRELPFYDFEFWFFQQILLAVDHWETGTDPFYRAKWQGIEAELAWADAALGRARTLQQSAELSLAGNRHDLSQTSTAGEPAPTIGRIEFPEVVHIVVDNFGYEYLGDLVLALRLAETGRSVRLHVKQLPMFVSDVTARDARLLMDKQEGSALLKGVAAAMESGGITVADDPLWGSPAFLDAIDPAWSAGEDLWIIKGDLNYRRAIGDVVVASHTEFERLPVLPSVPLLSLRSVKSYCLAGLSPEQDWGEDFPMDGSIFLVQKIPERARLTPSP